MKDNSENADRELTEHDIKGEDFTMRILVLLNENSPVVPALMFLKKQGYKLKAVYRLMDAIQELSVNKPDVLLMSWNLKKTDVRKAYGLLAKKFDTLCIVFGEENSKKTSSALMGSGIPHTLLPPVSGPGIHMRIQSLLRKRRMYVGERKATDFNDDIEAKTPQIVSSQTHLNEKGDINFDLIKGKSKSLNDLEKIKTDDIPAETRWDSLGDNVWRGTNEVEGKKTFFYFQGADSPQFDTKKKKWQGFGKVDIRASAENIDKQIKSQLQFEDKLSKDDYTDENAFENEIETLMQSVNLDEDKSKEQKKKTKNTTIDNKSDSKLVQLLESEYEAFTVLRPKSEKTSLSKGVQKAVATSIKPNKKNKKPLNVTTKVTVTMIKTSQFQGYLVGANADDIPDIALMNEVLRHLGTTMQDIGDAMDIKTKVLELEVDPIPFMIWVDSKAEFFVTSHHGENEVAYAYLPFLNMPEIVEAEADTDLIGIKLSSIYPNKPVPFNVYIYMPKNNKYLLYLKSGSKADTKILSKLIKFGVKHVYLNRGDEVNYHTYCAKYKIAEAYEDFKKTS